jgi:hypothetical protein
MGQLRGQPDTKNPTAIFANTQDDMRIFRLYAYVHIVLLSIPSVSVSDTCIGDDILTARFNLPCTENDLNDLLKKNGIPSEYFEERKPVVSTRPLDLAGGISNVLSFSSMFLPKDPLIGTAISLAGSYFKYLSLKRQYQIPAVRDVPQDKTLSTVRLIDWPVQE